MLAQGRAIRKFGFDALVPLDKVVDVDEGTHTKRTNVASVKRMAQTTIPVTVPVSQRPIGTPTADPNAVAPMT